MIKLNFWVRMHLLFFRCWTGLSNKPVYHSCRRCNKVRIMRWGYKDGIWIKLGKLNREQSTHTIYWSIPFQSFSQIDNQKEKTLTVQQ